MLKKIYVFIGIIFLSCTYLFADIIITPYGAAGRVSGSCFLVEVSGKNIIVDCGIFMEDFPGEDIDTLNSEIPDEIIKADALLLTHAHLDHSGKIPLLINKGFSGKIYSTQATKEIALNLFENRNGFDLIKRKWFWSVAQIQKARDHNFRVIAHWTDNCRRNIKNIEECKELNSIGDIESQEGVPFLVCKNCCMEETLNIEEFFETLDYNSEYELFENIKIKFINAAHVPGSASIILEAENKKIIFSGDIGSGYSRLNGSFDVPEKADIVFMEATYADKKSDLSMSDYDIFRNDLTNALKKDKLIWIPALSFNRTQKILYELMLMQESGQLAKDIPIYSISPSANALNILYKKEADKKEGKWFTEEVYQKDSIFPKNAKMQMLRNTDAPMIILSSSGDMSKGMSKGLIDKLVPRKDVSIMIVNYVGPNTYAGMLLAGKSISKHIKKNASIKKYDIFSDHPDFKMIQKWLESQNKEVQIYLIHSSQENANKMKNLLLKKNWKNINLAEYKEKILVKTHK